MGGRDESPEASAQPHASDTENTDPAEPGSLRKMFVQGTEKIATHRSDNLFQCLEQRTLTEEEQKIIEQRVALQRRMFEEYERRERKRKVAELREVCPDISEEEAEKALELCDGREDDAAAQLVADPGFRRRVKAACGQAAEPAPAATAPVAARREAGGSSRQQPSWQAKPGPRPKLIDPATLGGNVFVGAFRGKGFKPPPKGRQAARKAQAASVAAAAASSGSEQDEEDEDEDEEQQQEQQPHEQELANQEQQAVEQAQEEQQVQEEQAEQQAQQAQQGQAEAQAAAATAGQATAAGSVLLWPGAAAPQRYVLVQADTLQAPSDSQLRSARRQLGEPSITVQPTVNESAQPTPVSVARSRPAEVPAVVVEEAAAAGGAAEHAAVAEGGADGSGAAVPGTGAAMPGPAMLAAMAKQLAQMRDNAKVQALLQRMPSDAVRAAVLEQLERQDATRAAACRALLTALDAPQDQTEPSAEAGGLPAAGQVAEQQQQEDEEQQVQAAPASQGRSRRAAARTRRAPKRAASVALSDSEATETEEERASSSDESDDDFAAPAARRAKRAAPAVPALRRARPSRAAKNAAAATLAAYAVDSEEEGGAVEAAPTEAYSTEEEEAGLRRQTRRRGGTARAGSKARGMSASPAAVSPAKKVPAKKKQKMEEEEQEGAAAAAGASQAAPATSQQPQQGPSGSEQGSELRQQQGQQRRSSARASSSAAAEASDGGEAGSGAGGSSRPPQLPRVRAISSTGHTCRGRVKQKSHKSADLVEAGSLRAQKGWYNAGYIFPEGFHSRTLFRSSVAIDQLCVHECYIVGKGGQYWPQPTFKVVALDRPDEPLIAKSCTGCWTGILKRINAEIEARRKAGENLPPPPKTAIAGPEYFGLNQPNIQEAVEALDPEQQCVEYWAGKRDRQHAAAGLPVASGPARALRAPRQPSAGSRRNAASAGGGSSKSRKRRGGSDTEDDDGAGEEEDETQLMSSKWSAVSRAERYRNRLQENGEDTSALDEDNPLPSFIDPITMSAVVRPAISPYGYVAGLATWKVVLAEKQQCPFTNQPLQFEQLKVLTKTNIHLHRHKIVNGSTATTAAGS